MNHLTYLCLQQTYEGQASFAHVRQIIKGLERRGWTVQLHEVGRQGVNPDRGTVRRLLHAFVAQARTLSSLRHTDVLYVRFHVLAIPTVWFARRRAIPVVLEVNGPADEMSMVRPWLLRIQPLLSALSRWQLRSSQATIVVTEGLARWVEQFARPPIVEVIPNGVDTDQFTTPRPAQRSRPYAVFVGALAPWQGVDIMIEATRHPSWPDGIELVVAGDGVGLNSLLHASQTSNGRLQVLGAVPHDQVVGLLQQAICGLSVQSTFAGRDAFGVMPLKVFETMAAGVPVVCSDIEGQADVVREAGAGIVVPVDDPASVAQAVADLADDRARARSLGHAARTAAVERHSWDQRAGMTDALLRRLIRPAG